MPYILSKNRAQVRQQYVAHGSIKTAADLAYIVADAIDTYVGSDYNWDQLANAEKAVTSALDEFKLNVVQPYERDKREQNGDVFVLSRVLRDPA